VQLILDGRDPLADKQIARGVLAEQLGDGLRHAAAERAEEIIAAAAGSTGILSFTASPTSSRPGHAELVRIGRSETRAAH
jgi:hypothetical protein